VQSLFGTKWKKRVIRNSEVGRKQSCFVGSPNFLNLNVQDFDPLQSTIVIPLFWSYLIGSEWIWMRSHGWQVSFPHSHAIAQVHPALAFIMWDLLLYGMELSFSHLYILCFKRVFVFYCKCIFMISGGFYIFIIGISPVLQIK